MNTKNVIVLMCALIAAFLTGCGPAKVPDIKEIGPNETAWVVPLVGDTQGDQTKFNSVDYLNNQKVARKRIIIDKVTRSTGRFWYDYEWIPAVRVVTVDRSLVSREWVDNVATTEQNEGISVNTRDNISLTVGLTVTATIEEKGASTYLYYHGDKPLKQVIDENIRNFAIAELNRQVSAMTLTQFQTNQTVIYQSLFEDAKKAFAERGISIEYLGNAKGWHFADKNIQEAINKSFIAQQENQTAKMEQEAKATRNQTEFLMEQNKNKIRLASAQAEADAAKLLMASKEAAEFQNKLQIELITAKAKSEFASRWNGTLPSNILPAGSGLLLNLDK